MPRPASPRVRHGRRPPPPLLELAAARARRSRGAGAAWIRPAAPGSAPVVPRPATTPHAAGRPGRAAACRGLLQLGRKLARRGGRHGPARKGGGRRGEEGRRAAGEQGPRGQPPPPRAWARRRSCRGRRARARTGAAGPPPQPWVAPGPDLAAAAGEGPWPWPAAGAAPPGPLRLAVAAPPAPARGRRWEAGARAARGPCTDTPGHVLAPAPSAPGSRRPRPQALGALAAGSHPLAARPWEGRRAEPAAHQRGGVAGHAMGGAAAMDPPPRREGGREASGGGSTERDREQGRGARRTRGKKRRGE